MRTLTDLWNDSGTVKPCIIQNSDGYYMLLQTKLAENLYQGPTLTPVSSIIYLSKEDVVVKDDGNPIWTVV